MAELKTKKNRSSVPAFIASVTDERKREDATTLVDIFSSITKEKPTMWGDFIIGFGEYHYKSERSSQEGDWPLTGFSPRKQNISIYIMDGFNAYAELLDQLGPHKTSVSCLYIKRLSDINLKILKKIIRQSFSAMKKKYKVK